MNLYRKSITVSRRSGFITGLVLVMIILVSTVIAATFRSFAQLQRAHRDDAIQRQLTAIEASAIRWLAANQTTVNQEITLVLTPENSQHRWTATLKPFDDSATAESTLQITTRITNADRQLGILTSHIANNLPAQSPETQASAETPNEQGDSNAEDSQKENTAKNEDS